VNAPAGERVLLRRAAAAAVLGALALVCILEGPALWEWVAYREPVRDLGFEYRPKRWSWLPGPSMLLPAQPCPSCQTDDHSMCSGRTRQVTLRLTSTGAGFSPCLLEARGIGLTVVSSATGASVDEIRAASIAVSGVELSPETFRCPCCDSD